MADLNPIAPARVACKICGRDAPLFGVEDFNKTCEDERGKIFPVCGIPIYYHRCAACGFLFTTAFDHFSSDDFQAHIYNDGYAMADPEYAGERPRKMAELVSGKFAACRELRVLDYGGGTGLLAEGLRQGGFSQVESYDPFVAGHARKPEGVFDLVLSVEVMEHSPTPVETLREMTRHLSDTGMAVIWTATQPPDILTRGTHWWYVAPRNGHVSIHTPRSLELLAARLGYHCGSFSGSMHGVFKTLPPWAQGMSKS